MSPRRLITIEVSEVVYELLAVLGRDPDLGLEASVEVVVAQLVDHAQQGVYRSGSWERPWLEQAFGCAWQQYLEPGDPYERGTAKGDDELARRIFERPRRVRS